MSLAVSTPSGGTVTPPLPINSASSTTWSTFSGDNAGRWRCVALREKRQTEKASKSSSPLSSKRNANVNIDDDVEDNEAKKEDTNDDGDKENKEEEEEEEEEIEEEDKEEEDDDDEDEEDRLVILFNFLN